MKRRDSMEDAESECIDLQPPEECVVIGAGLLGAPLTVLLSMGADASRSRTRARRRRLRAFFGRVWPSRADASQAKLKSRFEQGLLVTAS